LLIRGWTDWGISDSKFYL